MTEVRKFTDIHFPRQIGLIKRLRFFSFIINDITLLVSFFILIAAVTDFSILRILFIPKLTVSPFTPVLFIFLSIVLFFGAKRHQIDSHFDADIEKRPWWEFGVPLILAALVAIAGFNDLAQFTNTGLLSIFHSSPYTGFCFFLLGLALIPPYTRIPHRFHITQLLIGIVSALNVFIILESTYQLLSVHPVQQIVTVSLPVAFSFTFFCFGILLRWSNRGFIGNFTLDSTASVFAFRVFMINLISAPIIAFITLLILQKSSYNLYQIVSIVIIISTISSSMLLWLNVKLLYVHELEHLLMRESLRAHNVDLIKDEEKLRKRMDQLQQEKQEYQEKLDSQSAWREAADRFE
jgi:FtsZ-binding cell division protein ZapB